MALMEERVRAPRELKGLKGIWIYLLGLLIAVAVILLFFTLNPVTETPPFP